MSEIPGKRGNRTASECIIHFNVKLRQLYRLFIFDSLKNVLTIKMFIERRDKKP